MSGKVEATMYVGRWERGGVGFTVLRDSEHPDTRYFAVRDTAPFFCFEAASLSEAVDTAYGAIDFYFSPRPSRTEPRS